MTPPPLPLPTVEITPAGNVGLQRCVNHASHTLAYFPVKRLSEVWRTFWKLFCVAVRFDLCHIGCNNPFFYDYHSIICLLHPSHVSLCLIQNFFSVFFFFNTYMNPFSTLTQSYSNCLFYFIPALFIPRGTNLEYIFSSLCWHKRNPEEEEPRYSIDLNNTSH